MPGCAGIAFHQRKVPQIPCIFFSSQQGVSDKFLVPKILDKQTRFPFLGKERKERHRHKECCDKGIFFVTEEQNSTFFCNQGSFTSGNNKVLSVFCSFFCGSLLLRAPQSRALIKQEIIHLTPVLNSL